MCNHFPDADYINAGFCCMSKILLLNNVQHVTYANEPNNFEVVSSCPMLWTQHCY